MKEKIRKILFHLFWLFLIGGIFGYVLETFWHFYKYHEWINKQGLWYGPIKPIYGFGLIIITLFLSKQRYKTSLKIFLIGIIIGSIYEYFTSCFQEYAFNTETWSYLNMNYNIHGRIYLPYCFAWGLITLIWIKFLLPFYLKFYKHMAQHKRFKLTYIFIILLLYNITLTAFITKRFANRTNHILPQTKLDIYLDHKYPDELVKQKFPKLNVLKK